jgi:hypothetical protein
MPRYALLEHTSDTQVPVRVQLLDGALAGHLRLEGGLCVLA